MLFPINTVIPISILCRQLILIFLLTLFLVVRKHYEFFSVIKLSFLFCNLHKVNATSKSKILFSTSSISFLLLAIATALDTPISCHRQFSYCSGFVAKADGVQAQKV